MKILKVGANAAARLLPDVATLLDELRKVNTPQQVLDELLKYAANPAAAGVVAGAVTALKLDGPAIQKFIQDNTASLTFILGNAGAAAKQKLSWPVAADTTLNVNAVALDLAASASATIAGDTDGDLFGDGTVTYDKTANAFLTYEVQGTVEADASIPSFPIGGSFSGKAAFSTGASILLGNYFQHGVNDSALQALIDDVRAFRLPYDAADLRDGQYIRMHNTGSVAISGDLSFGKTIVATGEVSAEDLGIAATPISADIKFGASLGFEAALSGDFNILVSRDAQPGRVRVRLTTARSSSRSMSFQTSVGAVIKGVDKVASSLVSQITTPLNALVKVFETNETKYGDLKKLFTTQVTTQVDQLVNGANVVTQIEDWLKEIGASVDLSEKLEEILTNAVDAKLGPLVNDIQTNLTPLTNGVKDLIRKYQAALAKVNAAVKAAAEIKIGIDLAHKRSKFETNKAALDLSIDPTLDVYKEVVRGDFTEALRMASVNEPGVTLNDATWSGSGGLSISSSLSVSAFGKNAGAGTLLKQDWEWELSASGDLTMGVSSSMQAWSQSWRALRSVTFLADTRVVAVVSRANQLLDPQRTDTATLESSIQWNPPATRAQLSEWEQMNVDLGILATPTDMTTALVVNASSKQPYGNITASAVLDLTESQLDLIADQPLDSASAQFVEQLTSLYLASTPNPFSRRDQSGFLFLLWKQVRAWGATTGGATTFPKNLEFFNDDRTTSVQVAKEQLPLVANALRIVDAFERMLQQLKSLRSGNLANLTVKQAVDSVAKEQRKLLEQIRRIIAATPMGREQLGQALFITVWQLAGGQRDLDPYVVILRKGATAEQDQRFVYV